MSKKKATPDEIDIIKGDSTVIVDKTPFPNPDLYFKVYESELDEPRTKVRQDVNKLYARWQEKYGRRWPENGLNTEDMVWLAEEAYPERKRKIVKPDVPPSEIVPIEREQFPGEFIPDNGAVKGEGGKKLSNYEATVAGGRWVTDEYDSAEYEMGNLELLWDMYLWDGEGKPLVMNPDPPNEMMGEMSEDWDDFHTAFRPRNVEEKDAQEAVWMTDEFESDEDNTESEWEPEYVGSGLGLKHEDPFNPQYSLRHSNHPLAPFPGEPLRWSSYVYADGTTFEGLTKQTIPHGMGVLVVGNGTGAGFHFRDVRRGDTFEGEFQAGFAHGLGQFSSEHSGEVFIGEYFAGQRHGCGISINMKPYYYLVKRGVDPSDAYQQTMSKVMQNIQFGTWYRGTKLGNCFEDEVILNEVLEDDVLSPAEVVLKNLEHEARLRQWVSLDEEGKQQQKELEVLTALGPPKSTGRRRWWKNADGKVVSVPNFDSDAEFDSAELLVGNTTNGGVGDGWFEDTVSDLTDSMDEYAAAMAAEDRRDESDDKEAVFGEVQFNPTSGLSLKDYMEGREFQYNMLFEDKGDPAEKKKSAADALNFPKQKKVTVPYLMDLGLSEKEAKRMVKQLEKDTKDNHLSRFMTRRKQPNRLDTETRFETESEMMEMCDMAEILGTVQEAQEIVARARMWRWKPDGEATFQFAQDANGTPITLMQDALHYPHGTKWMAPGPLGQVHPLPNHPAVREELLKTATLHQRIHNMYNFDYDPKPGSVMWQIDQRIRREQELKDRQLARVAEAAEALVKEEEAAAAAEAGKKPELALAALPQAGSTGGSMFASATLGMGRFRLGQASRAVWDTLERAARKVPTRGPQLGRPVKRTQ